MGNTCDDYQSCPKVLFVKYLYLKFLICSSLKMVLKKGRVNDSLQQRDIAIHSSVTSAVAAFVSSCHDRITLHGHDVKIQFHIFYYENNFSSVPHRNSHQCRNELQCTGKTCQFTNFSKSLPISMERFNSGGGRNSVL